MITEVTVTPQLQDDPPVVVSITFEKRSDQVRQPLLIMACPYCLAPEPHTEDQPLDQSGESVIVWCMACGEQCVITRNLEEDEDK